MFNKDIFLEHSQRVEVDDFTNQQFKRIFNILHDYYAENEYYNLSTALLYSDEEIDRETLIALDNLLLNNNPYEHEIDEYIQIIVSSRDEETSESLNQKLREATRIGDSELQKYYLQKIVALNQKRMY